MASSDILNRAHLILHDALTAPRQSVSLTAELLERHFLRTSGLGGEVLVFEHQGRPIGQAMTGGDGRAVKTFVPTTLGKAVVSARLASRRSSAVTQATARLFVWERNRSVILISLHALTVGSISPGPILPFAKSDGPFPDPEPQAVRMLSSIARRHALIYLCVSDPLELRGLREWADRHRVPPGPMVLIRGARGFADELDRLRAEGWTGIKAGLASTPGEAKSFLDRGRRAVTPPAASRQKWPAGALQPKDWEDTGRRLTAA
jgi:hypothetical protein